MAVAEVLSLPEAAALLKVGPWTLRKMFRRGLIKEAPRVGLHRCVLRRDLPRLRRALEAGGFLRRIQELQARNTA